MHIKKKRNLNTWCCYSGLPFQTFAFFYIGLSTFFLLIQLVKSYIFDSNSYYWSLLSWWCLEKKFWVKIERWFLFINSMYASSRYQLPSKQQDSQHSSSYFHIISYIHIILSHRVKCVSICLIYVSIQTISHWAWSIFWKRNHHDDAQGKRNLCCYLFLAISSVLKKIKI